MLIYSNATYMQVREGRVDDVHAVFRSIQKDPRNIGVAVTVVRFAHWDAAKVRRALP